MFVLLITLSIQLRGLDAFGFGMPESHAHSSSHTHPEETFDICLQSVDVNFGMLLSLLHGLIDEEPVLFALPPRSSRLLEPRCSHEEGKFIGTL
ncbi:hypothetical protein C8Q74DRAFT_1276235, partial [Fomes fomentarius]